MFLCVSGQNEYCMYVSNWIESGITSNSHAMPTRIFNAHFAFEMRLLFRIIFRENVYGKKIVWILHNNAKNAWKNKVLLYMNRI